MAATAIRPTTKTIHTGRTGNIVRSVLLTLVTLLIVFLFLLPFFNMVFTSLKTTDQMSEAGAPIWPALPGTAEIDGKTVEVYEVPMPDGTVQDLAIVKKGRQQTTFVDPANPQGEPIVWEGAWRTLDRSWTVSPTWSNFYEAWVTIDFPLLFRNTLAIALFGLIGTVVSSTLVGYGFARFRFPLRNFWFTVLVSTIFLPAAVTIIPTYAFFVRIGWVGTWLPLIVPHYFSNAYNVFLMRQYIMTIPREMDEARPDGRRRPHPHSLGHDHPAVQIGHAGRGALSPGLCLERLLWPAALPVHRARPAADLGRPAALQQHLWRQSAA